MIEEYLTTRTNLQRVFMIVDSRIKPTENDVLMYNYLTYHNLPVTVIATKFDKVKAKDREKNLKHIHQVLNIIESDNLVYFSSITKKGRDEVYEIIAKDLNIKETDN